MDCKICNKVLKNTNGLHRHLGIHDISIPEYYYKFFPRYDKGNESEFIIYKNYDQYFNTDFNSRENFVSWAADNESSQEVADYCLDTLKKRRERKNETYVPSQVELKSLLLPSYVGFEKIFGNLEDFFKLADGIGYKPRFDYFSRPKIYEGNIEILIDTREQRPLSFSHPTKVMKLPTGDYCGSKNLFTNVFVERKSIPDLYGTLTNNVERFYNEIQKAQELGFYLVVVVEGGYTETMNFELRTKFKSKINGAHVFHEIRNIMLNYSNIQFLFAGSRHKASHYIEQVIRIGESVRNYDLEYLKDRKLL